MRSRLLRAGVAVLFVAVMCIGAGQVLAKKPPKPPLCPAPTCGYACTTEYAPVACLVGDMHCIYSNMCVAICAGQSEANCTGIGGPIPLPM